MKDENERDGCTVTIPNSTKTELFIGQKEKFKKEAKRMFSIKNEHIIGVHDLFEENGTAYYVMDYVDGENLAERLKRTGLPMSEQEVRDILPQVLDALKSVHDAGVWHLDLKPANIMIDKSGNIKLFDFGASKQMNTLERGATATTAVCYTNGYAPQEQMEQNYDKFGPWTDIYALGATLYNLLTNKRPPLPSDIDEDCSEDKHEALPFPESVGDIRHLVLKMMKTNRSLRPKSISEVSAMLESHSEYAEKTDEKPLERKEESKVSEETVIAVSQSEETVVEPKAHQDYKSEIKYEASPEDRKEKVFGSEKTEKRNSILRIDYLVHPIPSLWIIIISFFFIVLELFPLVNDMFFSIGGINLDHIFTCKSVNYIIMAVLLLSLYRGLRKLDKYIPWLIIGQIGMCLLRALCIFSYSGNGYNLVGKYASFELLDFIDFMSVELYYAICVVSFVIGFFLTWSYAGKISRLGIVFILFSMFGLYYCFDNFINTDFWNSYLFFILGDLLWIGGMAWFLTRKPEKQNYV